MSPPYTEGSAHQYVWMVPHDPEGLLELMGSAEVMVERLEAFFEGAVVEQAATPDFAEYDDLFWMGYTPTEYWHGNEPDIHAAYLFAVAGRPDLTQKWLNWIMNTLYHTGNTGIPGNDDAGTLAAWYVFSAMGFYPQAGSTQYIIGAPLFERMEVRVGSNTLVIQAPNVSAENIYVQSVTLNEQKITTPRLNHADLEGGGVLHFEMGPAPSNWGRGE
ncbi:MAG TPA: hypothetical protein EYN66_03385 [Myxococcales bacterium]|nr:hypothetical protein [Myxococcales bacterium]